MSERWARTLLGTYRWAGAAAYPLIGSYVGWRARRGKEDPHRRKERYGYASRERPHGPVVWVHAASVGETSAVVPLVEGLMRSGICVVLTTGTVTSARLVEERMGERIIHQYVPLDLKPAVSRFLDYWKPDLAIMAESEIWPMTILELGARRVPQVLVNGRLSDRSFRSWKARSYLAEALFENLAMVVAQTEKDAERFRILGARPVIVSGNLKVDTEPPPVNERTLAELRFQIGDRPTWAAVSTHAGEEEIAARTHIELRERHPGLLTIIVPRHPDRAEQLAERFAAEGLLVSRRSVNQPVLANTDILLGDTIGDMGLYLRLTEVAFVGKSLTGEGGQNPLEPAMLNTAILSGKNVQNFREAYQRLIKDGGARLVRDVDMLAEAVSFLLKNPKARRKMIDAAASTVDDMRGALARTYDALEPFTNPLIVSARLGRNGNNGNGF